MIEINRWIKDEAGNLSPNLEFTTIFRDGVRVGRSPLLECSGRYECCYIYKDRVYENWVNWGYDCIYLLQHDDNHNTHQDREGRVGETYSVDRCQTGSELIEQTY